MNFFELGARIKVSRKGTEVTKVTVMEVMEDGGILAEDNFNPDRVVIFHYLDHLGCWVANPLGEIGGLFNPNFHYMLGFAG